MNRIHANGLDFAFLEQGDGPVVLLLHGFPDNAHTWSYQLPALADAGYRAVAPFLRGYSPTEVPANGFYGIATLATDIAEIIRRIGNGKPVHLVGQDWGAIIGYAVIAAFPELVNRAVVAAVPHSDQVKQSMLDVRHIQRSFHWWFFQVAELPEKAIIENDFAFIDYLWDYWTSSGFSDTSHIADVKKTLSEPGVLKAALAYYRSMLDTTRDDPKLAHVRELISRKISVPTLALCGADDMRAELMTSQQAYFTGEYRFELIPDAGHFPHREQPDAVNQQILNWLN